MKKSLLVLFMLVIVSGVYAQKDIMADYNGNFEQGTPALSSVFRDALVDADGYRDIIGDQEITDDPYVGDSALYTIWPAFYEGLAELVLDTWSAGIPVKAGSSYEFKFAAYKIAGPTAVLHSTVGFFDAEGNVLYEESGNFTLGDFYEEFAQAAIVAPEGAATCWVGFRMFGADGARWAEDEVEAMIDEIKLLETGPSTDIMANYNGNFEQGTPPLASVFRDALVDADGYRDIIGDQSIIDDPYEGDSALYTIWPAFYDGLAELVLDTWSAGIPVKPGASYEFKFAAYKIAGPTAVLRTTVGFFDAEGNVLYEESGDFTLGDFYEEFAQTAVVAPEGAATCWIGFRVFGADGARWPDDEVEAMIDEIKLLETGGDTTPPTSIRNEMANAEVRVYPNPVLDRLHIDAKSNIKSVSVYNILGYEVMLRNLNQGNNASIDFAELPAGMYLVRVISQDGSATKKILKN